MEFARFDCASPFDSRYFVEDDELYEKVEGYGKKDIFFEIKRIVPEVVIPRVCLLEKQLSKLAEENSDKKVFRRVDGRHSGVISIEEVFRTYEERLRGRRECLEKLPLDFRRCEAIRNDKIYDLVSGSVSILGVEASIANDIRHGFRSEIGEYTQSHALDFGSPIVGSSTIPHKVNPKDFEKVVSF